MNTTINYKFSEVVTTDIFNFQENVYFSKNVFISSHVINKANRMFYAMDLKIDQWIMIILVSVYC